MIIIQTDSEEESTDEVIDWLFYIGRKDIKRLNDITPFTETSLRINTLGTKIKIQGTDIAPKSVYWYHHQMFIKKTGVLYMGLEENR